MIRNTTSKLNCILNDERGDDDDDSTNGQDFTNEMNVNLRQIESILDLIKLKHQDENGSSNFLYRLTHLFENLTKLMEFYKNNSGLIFVKFVLIKKINYFNELFNLNKKLVWNSTSIQNNFTTESSVNRNQSNNSLNQPLNYLNNYEKFDKIEANCSKHNNDRLFKLIIKAFKFSNLNIELNQDGQFELCVFQYNKTKDKGIRKSLRQMKSQKRNEFYDNDDNNSKKIYLRNKSQPKKFMNNDSDKNMKNDANKRSCSADQNVNIFIKKRDLLSRLRSSKTKLNIDDREEENKNSNEDLLKDECLSSSDNEIKDENYFKLDQTYIQFDSIRINNQNNEPKIIDLNKHCSEVVLILYKLIRIMDDYDDDGDDNNNQNVKSYAKIAIKYEQYQLDKEMKNLSLKSYKCLNKSFFNNDRKTLQYQPVQQQQSSNVFKRIFKKSKSSNRLNSLTQMDQKQQLTTQNSHFELDLVKNEMEFFINPTNIIKIENLNNYINIWNPKLETEGIVCYEKISKLGAINLNLKSLNLNSKFSKLNNQSSTQTIISNRSSSSSSGISTGNNSEIFSDDYYYYIKIDRKEPEQSFFSTICSLNEHYDNEYNLNDLFQMAIDFGSNLNESLKVNIQLYKVNIINSQLTQLKSEQIALNTIEFLNSCFSQNVTINLNGYIDLKLEYSYKSEYLPFKKASIDFYNTSSNDESELSVLIDKFLLDYSFDLILIRKCLNLFSTLNINTANLNRQIKQNDNTNIDRRNNRKILLKKLYEVFIRLLNDYGMSCMKKVRFNQILINFEQPKCAIHTLIHLIKSQSELSESPSPREDQIFEMTLKNFDLVIEALVILSSNLYELKYDLNDIFSRLSKKLDLNRQLRLNYKFINHLDKFYSANELASLILSKFLNNFDASHVKILNQYIFKLPVFINNYQFRDSIVEFIINNYLNINAKIISIDYLMMIKEIIRYKFKISRQNLDLFVKYCLKLLINSLINNLKQIKEKLEILNYNFNGYVCLMELLDLIQINNNKSYNSIEFISNYELKQIFQIIINLKGSNLSKSFSLYFHQMDKVWLNTNHIIIKFSNYIQKYLHCYLINNDLENDSLIRTYFDMILTFLDQPSTLSLSLTEKMKLEMLNCLITFWRNMKLKRSIILNELILTKLCQCFIKSIYFKSICLFELNASSKMVLNPFIAYLQDTKENSIFLFYSQLIKFFHEIYAYNSFDIKVFGDFLYFNIMNLIIKNDRKKRKNLTVSSQVGLVSSIETDETIDQYIFNNELNNDSNNMDSVFKMEPKLVLEMIKMVFNETKCPILFGSYQNSNLILNIFEKCFDYLILKEENNEKESSSIEKQVILYDLIKQTDNLNYTHLIFNNNQKYFYELKRKIQLYLLDDLYHLNKLERNYLQMSFIRKEQADLLEWSLAKKTESDMKEMLYLKSLKKLSLNSLNNENFLIQDTKVLSNYFKNQDNLIKNKQKLNNDSGTNSNNANSLKVQFEICKELCEYYENLNSNTESGGGFDCILNTESKFIELASNTFMKLNTIYHSENILGPNKQSNINNHGNVYFRVGFFGAKFKFESMKNKYFLYKHNTYEMLSNIQNMISKKILSSYLNHFDMNLLLHNQEPDLCVKNSVEKIYIQVCALNKIDRTKLLDLMDEIEVNEKEVLEWKINLRKSYDKTSSFYYFDRPFYLRNSLLNRNNKNDHVAGSETSSNRSSSLNDELSLDEENNSNNITNNVENLWIERTVLILDENSFRYDHLVQFDEIKNTFKLLLNPIRNAISDINEKSKELKNFINQFSLSNSKDCYINNNNKNNLNLIHSLQPLTMRLLGCLDARVNGGLIKYVRELLNESIIETNNYKKKKQLLIQLYMSIKDQLKILENGLCIHDRILKNIEASHESTEYYIKNSSNSKNSNISNNNIEHIKHMNELNSHLIDCLKLLTSELDDKWSKIC